MKGKRRKEINVPYGKEFVRKLSPSPFPFPVSPLEKSKLLEHWSIKYAIIKWAFENEN